MNYVEFRLSLTQAQFLEYYRGAASQVHVVSSKGQRIAFPAAILRPHVSDIGIQGHFRLTYDENNRLSELIFLGS